jgi:hypothetical protein
MESHKYKYRIVTAPNDRFMVEVYHKRWIDGAVNGWLEFADVATIEDARKVVARAISSDDFVKKVVEE